MLELNSDNSYYIPYDLSLNCWLYNLVYIFVMFFTMLFKQAAQQSSRFRPCIFQPSKIQVPAGTEFRCTPTKRVLVFFNVDQTTAVFETTKVKNVSQGDKIQEGATVLVEFGKEVFEASVVKLHGKSLNE